jgi:hypothetical protein
METDRLPNNRQPQYGAVDNSVHISGDISTSPPSSASSIEQSDSTASSVDVNFQMTSTLNFFEKIGYGLGHVYNDLAAGVWFSYTLLFMQGALSMSATVAGALVMFGQVGDAIATPIVGLLADKYGTKRGWHIAGEVECVHAKFMPNFHLIFRHCADLPHISADLLAVSLLRGFTTLVDPLLLLLVHLTLSARLGHRPNHPLGHDFRVVANTKGPVRSDGHSVLVRCVLQRGRLCCNVGRAAWWQGEDEKQHNA